MRKYNFRLIFLVLLISCLSLRAVDEIEAEKEASLRVEGFLGLMESQAQKLLDLSSGVKRDLAKIKQIFDALEKLELSVIPQVELADSQRYDDFLNESNMLLRKTSLSEITGIVIAIKELLAASLKEQRTLSDSLLVRKLVDKARSYKLVSREKDKIDEHIKQVEQLRATLHNKIEDAAKNMSSLLGDPKVHLNHLASQAGEAKSLKDISGLLNDSRLNSLDAQLSPRLFEASNFVQALVLKALEKSRAQQKAIYDLLAISPASQEDIDKLARDLDRILENKNELEQFANTKGITTLDTIKNTKLAEVISKKPAPVRPMPGVRAPLTVQRSIKEALAFFKDKVNKITATKLVPARKDFVQAYAALTPFYDQDKLERIKQAVAEAENLENYKNSGQKLIDAVDAYTVEGLKGLLEKDGVAGSNDEVKFNDNFKKLSEMINQSLFSRLNKHKQDIINKRLDFLKAEFNSHEKIKKIGAIMAKIQAAINAYALKESCQALKETNYLKAPLNCSKFGSNLDEALVGATGIDVLKALSAAKILLRERLEPYLDMVKAATMESEFNQAIAALNSVLSSSSQIDSADFKAKFPEEGPYTVAGLINEIVEKLKKEEVSTGRSQLKYSDVLEAYVNELDPNMTASEIDILQRKVSKPSKHNLATTLQLMLSPSGYDAVLKPFVAPKEDQLVAAMKTQALASLADGSTTGAGIPDLENAIKSAEEALDEFSIKDTLEKLATFFGQDKAQELREIAKLTRVDLDLSGQKDKIQELVEANSGYKALKSLAELAPKQVDDFQFEDLIRLAQAVPASMRSHIFGKNEIEVEKEFNSLKDRFKQNLETLEASIPAPTPFVKDEDTILPVVNSFSLVFRNLLTELNKLAFDGTDDQRVKTIFEKFVRELNYVEKFKGLRSAITLENASTQPPAVEEIIKLLKEVQDKLKAATSAAKEIDDLKKFMNSFLE